MKKTMTFILSLSLILSLAGCGTPSAAPTATPEATRRPGASGTDIPAPTRGPVSSDTDIREPAAIPLVIPMPEHPIELAVVGEGTLEGFADYEEFVEFDDEGYQRIILTTSETVTELKFLSVEHYGNSRQRLTVLYEAGELRPERPFVVTWIEWGSFPHRGVSFVDENGQERYFAIIRGGLEPGPPVLSELIPDGSGSYDNYRSAGEVFFPELTRNTSYLSVSEPDYYEWIPDLSAEGLKVEMHRHYVCCASGEDSMVYRAPGLPDTGLDMMGRNSVSFGGKNYSFRRTEMRDEWAVLTLYGDPPSSGCRVTALSSPESEPTAEVLAAYFENPFAPPEGYERTAAQWFARYAKPSLMREGYAQGKLYAAVWPEWYGERAFDEDERGDNELHREADGLEWYVTERSPYGDLPSSGETLTLYCRTDGLVIMLLVHAYESAFPLQELATPDIARVFADNVNGR